MDMSALCVAGVAHGVISFMGVPYCLYPLPLAIIGFIAACTLFFMLIFFLNC